MTYRDELEAERRAILGKRVLTDEDKRRVRHLERILHPPFELPQEPDEIAAALDESLKGMSDIDKGRPLERSNLTLYDPRTTREAARWLLACESGWRGRRVSWLLRDDALVVASRAVPDGLAIWRLGIATRDVPDLVVARDYRVRCLALQISAWICDMEA